MYQPRMWSDIQPLFHIVLMTVQTRALSSHHTTITRTLMHTLILVQGRIMQQGGETTECWECTFLCSLGNITHSYHALVACWQDKDQQQTHTHTSTQSKHKPDADIGWITLENKLNYENCCDTKPRAQNSLQLQRVNDWSVVLYWGHLLLSTLFKAKYVRKGQNSWLVSNGSSSSD